MDTDHLLAPSQAQAVVDDRIERCGTGALPRVSVDVLDDGTWRVRWDHLEQIVAPMNQDEWLAWLNINVGSMDAGDLDTTES